MSMETLDITRVDVLVTKEDVVMSVTYHRSPHDRQRETVMSVIMAAMALSVEEDCPFSVEEEDN